MFREGCSLQGGVEELVRTRESIAREISGLNMSQWQGLEDVGSAVELLQPMLLAPG